MSGSSSAEKIEADLRQHARRHPRLTAEAETELLARRDPAAVETLVEHNLDLVVGQAERHLDHGLGFADLFQEGSVGLVDAISAYAGGGDFRQFASLHIGLQMDSLIEAEKTANREAAAHLEDVRLLDLAEIAFRQRERRPATDIEMAQLLGWDMERFGKVRGMLELAREENDAATIGFLDDTQENELGVDFLDDEEPEADPRRRPSGAGPDE
jgi:DNA-directed RNA polymerase sigma subunit (sigma70/sigma32)